MKLRLLFLLVLLINTGRGQTPFLTGVDLDFMELQSGILYWKAGCAPGPVSSIARVPAGSLAVATYFRPATCGGSNVDSANVAMDSARNVYWSTRDGRIVMLPADASTASTPVTLAQMAGAPAWLRCGSRSPRFGFTGRRRSGNSSPPEASIGHRSVEAHGS